ncbi:MAG: hypothetical protein GQ534_05490 [Candidatus Delongbacteria bacterium]|nr:hypothetical protein [Candidatus Delongbacteria bacterium]
MRSNIIIIIFITIIFSSCNNLFAKKENSIFIFKANGLVTLGNYIYGEKPKNSLEPGFRSNFRVYFDIIRYKKLILNFLIANTTTIGKNDESFIDLDKIRYTLSPGFRYEYQKWIINGLLLHECLHTISRDEINGSTWWNAFQIGAGTRGSYHYYLVDKYNSHDFSLSNSFDINQNFGFYLYGEESSLIIQNHNYRIDEFGLIRYHFGSIGNKSFYVDLNHRAWYDANQKITAKLSLEGNLILKAKSNFVSIYFRHCFIDENPHDNEKGLGVIGFKLIF